MNPTPDQHDDGPDPAWLFTSDPDNYRPEEPERPVEDVRVDGDVL